MKLSEKQAIFARYVAKLIMFVESKGWAVTFGEAYRSRDQQVLYFTGQTFNLANKLVRTRALSKTMNSSHLNRMAVDFNLFMGGVYKTDKASYKPLGDYWKSLDPKNVWGGDWGWDANHFETKV